MTRQPPVRGQTGVNPTWGADNTPGLFEWFECRYRQRRSGDSKCGLSLLHFGQLTGTGMGGSTDERAALQLAVWEALYDTTASGKVSGLRFTVSGGDAAAISQANTWISDMNSLADVGAFGYTGTFLIPID